MNLPKNVNDILPPGVLNNILPNTGKGGVSNFNIPKNPLDAVNQILPTGMLNNIMPAGSGGISIILDNPNNCYYAGTVVSGKIVVQMDRPDNIRALVVKLRGVAHVTWNESGTETTFRSGSREGMQRTQEQTVTTTYSSEEEYFSNKFNILGETELPAGTQTYQFSCPLPPLLPASFSGEYGAIKYTVKATIDRPWKFDQTAEMEFKVITPMDLNHNAVAKEQVKKEGSKSFCCLFCQSGPLTLNANLPYSGYVPGQAINISVQADNASNVEIDNMIIKIDKTITWICHKPSRKERYTHTELANVKLEGVNPHGSKAWNQQVVLPSDLSFTNIDACSVIKMKHILRVIADVGGCHGNLEIEIPLIIGTVPIQGSGISPVFPGGHPGGGMPSYPSDTIGPSGPVLPSYPATGPGIPSPTQSMYPPSGPPAPGIYPPPANQNPNINPYPPTNINYPPTINPYPPTNNPYPPTNNPYPPTNNTNPPANNPYPPTNNTYPHTNNTNPPANNPYPPTNNPYPPTNNPYPPTNNTYPPVTNSYPPANNPYPPTNNSYASSTTPYPPTSNAYPPSNINQPANPSYPASTPSAPPEFLPSSQAIASPGDVNINHPATSPPYPM